MLESTSSPFIHPKNIVYGAGRVVFVDGHDLEPSGWHLPGLRVTVDPEEAARAAKTIDALTVANEHHIGTGFVGGSERP